MVLPEPRKPVIIVMGIGDILRVFEEDECSTIVDSALCYHKHVAIEGH